MDWNNIISHQRTGDSNSLSGPRSSFQRDFDRLIFSSAFRRLQNKAQIFPLPGSTFVHNRLTHSLEVASVGRSLGKLIGEGLIIKKLIEPQNKEFYKYELQNVIAAACLAHDIGNPSFGHSGEKAISNYFDKNQNCLIENDTKLKDYFIKDEGKEEWADLISFEGNANSFRILTHYFNGKSPGGYKLTYSTLASMLKYPCDSEAINDKKIHTKKFSFFQSDKYSANEILETLNVKKESDKPLIFNRHPFVYLTEAADDICYRIVDFEDAQRLKILSHKAVSELFLHLIESIGRKEDNINSIKDTFGNINDKNENISYLRAKCINSLILQTSELYLSKIDSIIKGAYNSGLLDELTKTNHALSQIKKISEKEIYNHDSVVELEITGYQVMEQLLSLFVPAILKKSPSHRDKKIIKLLPKQFHTKEESDYEKVMSVLDFISGMTDPFAIELYRKLFGIEIPKHF